MTGLGKGDYGPTLMGINQATEEIEMTETTTTKAVIHRGDPRFCRSITVGGEEVGHLEPSVDHLGMRL